MIFLNKINFLKNISFNEINSIFLKKLNLFKKLKFNYLCIGKNPFNNKPQNFMLVFYLFHNSS